ncbi:amidohydrolase family protein [Verrucosispora sp. NA02020]|uniref:amidohydrolase family protein n=1 Tax=Verrucosispora sp. NA02020 TaxID=2742132 RepID=UPI003D76228F
MADPSTTGPQPDGTDAPVPADLVLRHGRVVTLDPRRRILTDGTIVVHAGRIRWVGSDRLRPATTGPERDLAGAVVHPGLVDAHVHTGTETVRGLAPKGAESWETVEEVAYLGKTPYDEELAATLSAMDMVSSGTTLFADTGGSVHLDATARGIAAVGMRGIPGHILCDVPQDGVLVEVAADTDTCLARLRDQLDRYPWRPDARVRAAVTLVGMGLDSDALLTAAAGLAEEYDVPLIMHQSWDRAEVDASLAGYGVRPVTRLRDLGLLGARTTLVHMIQTDDAERDLVRETGTRVVHCPSASLRRAKGALRDGRFPEMVADGVTVALGSDGLSGPRDLFRQAYLAATVFRELRDELPTLTAEQVLEMSTLHGARALGMSDEVGSIEVGKRADLVVHATDRPQSLPAFDDPVDWLVFYAGARTVDTVLVDGEILYDRGRFTRIDTDEVLAAVADQARRHERAIGPDRFARWPLIR